MKKLIVLICMILPLGVFSQEVKIAVVNAAEVFNMMPELTEVESQLGALGAQYQNDLQSLQNDFNTKYEEYMKLRDSLPENLRMRREEELQQIQERSQSLLAVAHQDMEQKRMELSAPVEEKLSKAIQEIGAEQGYTFILNAQVLLYTGPSAVDATPLVKAKLGLR